MSNSTLNNYGDNAITRADIEKLLLEKSIRLVDSDDKGLELFCHVSCENDSHSDIKKCRGVIFKNDKLVLKSYPFHYEVNQSDFGFIENDVVNNFDKCTFYNAYEGSMIRLFYFADTWYVATNKKLDAFKSKWASKESFGANFKIALENEIATNTDFQEFVGSYTEGDDILESLKTKLDTQKQYMFLLLNNEENRLVSSSPEKPTVFHVGTYVNSSFTMSENIGLKYPETYTFENIDAIYDFVDGVNFKNLQGLMIYTPNNIYKVYNKQYYKFLMTRGNESSIKFRYLQVRLDRESADILYYLFPDYAQQFDEYEDYIYQIASDIYNAYIERFIKKQYVTVPPEEFSIIKKCHSWHNEDRHENRISFNKVVEFLNLETPTSLNRMIRHLKIEKYNQENGIVTEPIVINVKPRENSEVDPRSNGNSSNYRGRGGRGRGGGGRGRGGSYASTHPRLLNREPTVNV
jgi:hypothetical protein